VNTNDLICTQKLSLVQALNAEPVKITTLDDRKLTITMDEIISPQTVKVVKSEGMPIFDKANPLNNVLFKEKKGDIFIKFDIYFPKFIDPEKKEEIIRLLEDK
jgi:DnaJ-class molecular chaperone